MAPWHPSGASHSHHWAGSGYCFNLVLHHIRDIISPSHLLSLQSVTQFTMKNDRDRMKCIISETIVALCNSGLDFSNELSIEGLLGITLDGRDIILVNINEVIKSCATKAKLPSSRDIVSDNEGIFSEVSPSSGPTPMGDLFVESHDSTDNTYSTHVPAQAQLSDASGEIAVTKREDCVIRTLQVKVESEPEEVISIHDDEDDDSRCTDAKSEYHHQFGAWTESFDDYTDAEPEPIASQTTAQCSIIQLSQPNGHRPTSDQISETVEYTTDGCGSMPRGYQEHVVSAPAAPMPVSLRADVSPLRVSTPAASGCQRSQVKTGLYFAILLVAIIVKNIRHFTLDSLVLV